MRERLLIALLLTLSSITFCGGNLWASGNSAFFVIVNSQNSIDSLDRKFLADLYLKKITHWPGDGVIQPVDLRPDSPARRQFSEEVLNRSVMGVKNYWQQLIFSGQDVPPPELRTDSDVIQFVHKNPSSIGYVSSATAISPDNGIKVIDIE